MDMSAGNGSALDATVSTLTIAEIEDLLAAKRSAVESGLLAANVEAARAKVAKMEAHLADAQRALTDAEAALAAEGN